MSWVRTLWMKCMAACLEGKPTEYMSLLPM